MAHVKEVRARVADAPPRVQLLQLIKALPDAEDAPPLLLPMGWEQRCDEKSRRIFFVDHITCSTTWEDPRLRKKEEEEAGADVPSKRSDDADRDDHFDGAAADLAALSLGLQLPSRDEQLGQWSRAVERNAHAALLKETAFVRSAADVTQCPRFMLVQRLHGAVVHRVLAEASPMLSPDELWRHRHAVLAPTGAAAQAALPREALSTLAKHAADGLTNTYRNHTFGARKLHLRKVKKVLASLTPSSEQRLPVLPPALPDTLESQLYAILLNPPGAAPQPSGTAAPPGHSDDLDVWSLAADAVLSLALVTGSLLTLLQLPRAIYCRGAKIPPIALAHRLYHFQRRAERGSCAAWPGASYWISEAGAPRWESAPAENSPPIAAAECAVVALVSMATAASSVWCRLAEREGITLFGAATAHAGGGGGAAPERSLLGLRSLRLVVDGMIDLAMNRHPTTTTLTAQHVTEMWQPLGVELKRDTLTCLVSLCISLLTGERGRREIVSAVCALRVLTVHLQLFERCGVDVSLMLPIVPPPVSASGGAPAGTDGLRGQLLDRLYSVLLLPVSRVDAQLQPLWGAMQAEVVCVLVAGMRTFFPSVPIRAALLHAALQRAKHAASTSATSPFFGAYINALWQWLGAQKDVSVLIAATNESQASPEAPESLAAALPRALTPVAMPLEEIQKALWRGLLEEAERDVSTRLTSTTREGLVTADSARFLAAASQEIFARASLCNVQHQPENVTLLALAETVITRATRLLTDLPTPDSPRALTTLQAQLKPTFIGGLLPWLADALSLYSAFAFDYSQRLLPIVLELLGTLKRLLSTDAAAMRREPASARAQTAPSVPMNSPHPYKPPGPAPGTKAKRDKAKLGATRREEKHEWPGASQLTLKFDRRCCTEEGDWLSLVFFKVRHPRPRTSLTFCDLL